MNIMYGVTNGVKFVYAFDGVRYGAYTDHIDDAKLWKTPKAAKKVADLMDAEVMMVEVSRRQVTC